MSGLKLLPGSVPPPRSLSLDLLRKTIDGVELPTRILCSPKMAKRLARSVLRDCPPSVLQSRRRKVNSRQWSRRARLGRRRRARPPRPAVSYFDPAGAEVPGFEGVKLHTDRIRISTPIEVDTDLFASRQDAVAEYLRTVMGGRIGAAFATTEPGVPIEGLKWSPIRDSDPIP